jgi:flavin reductase (DIM6/NTAB) family NADH-FMN oxidoreductase RutF
MHFRLRIMLTKKINDSRVEFESINPKILYCGTPVALVSSINHENTHNLAPISSFWALGWTMVLGLLHIRRAAPNAMLLGR